jgi:hypothetical protein
MTNSIPMVADMGDCGRISMDTSEKEYRVNIKKQQDWP